MTGAQGVRRASVRAAVAVSVLLLIAPGCVESGNRRRPAPVESVQLPNVARPAPGRSLTTRVRVSIRPVGTVPSDGAVLPIVSPDGRFIASQTGEAPSWETLLAEPGEAEAPLWTGIGAWQLVADPAPGEPGLLPIDLPDLPDGVTLGRSADTTGFLVEQERPDGTRRVGRASWVTGRVGWLSPAGVRDSHAVLTGSGDEVLLIRRTGTDGAPVLTLVRGGDTSRLELATGRALMPVIGLAGELGVISRAGDQLELIEVHRDAGRLAIVARRRLGLEVSGGGDAGLLEAFQMVAGVQTPSGLVEGEGGAGGFVVFHPRRGRMAVVRPGRRSFELVSGTFAACGVPTSAGGGWLATRGSGLLYVPPEGGTEGAELTDTPFVGRLTTRSPRPWVLLGPPQEGESEGVGVVLLGLGTGESAGRASENGSDF